MAIRVNALYGVYDADGGMRGELQYLWGAYVRNQHCSFCDITHSKVRRRPQWTEFVERCPVPFHALHLNELEPELAEFVKGKTPCVVSRTDSGYVSVLSDAQLRQCRGSVESFEVALDAALATSGLTFR
jgi:hypothetical protein